MRTGMNSLKWEGIGTKNLFPHTSSSNVSYLDFYSRGFSVQVPGSFNTWPAADYIGLTTARASSRIRHFRQSGVISSESN